MHEVFLTCHIVIPAFALIYTHIIVNIVNENAGMDNELSGWAEVQWGACELGNTQRNKRAVEISMRMAAQPGAGLPEQMGSKAIKR